MSDESNFWEGIAPYLSYLEDNFLDLDGINRLSDYISEPVLVIGAGQGLLVEGLKNKGFDVDGIDSEPEMVAWAKKRRNLDLILASGEGMPLDDNSYQTSIIATGVIDLLDDHEEIRSILNEAMRVTDDNGKVFIAFYRFSCHHESLMRYLGLITDDNRWRARRMFELVRLNPIALLREAAKQADVSFISALFRAIPVGIRLTRKEKESMKLWARMWSEVDNPEELIGCVPVCKPYRNEERVRSLFEELDIPIKEVFQMASSFAVQI